MLARSTLGRWAAAKTSTRNLPQLARFVHRTILARNASDLPVARALSRAYTSALHSRRSYATTTAATKPTATVKKAVKAQAASKAAPKKKAAASSRTAKKPAKKTAAARAKPKTRAKATPKAKPKKKAAPKKPAAKRRVKKVLTDEQKLKAKIAELRKVALKEPVTNNSVSALNVYVAESVKGSQEGSHLARLGTASQSFKALTPAEREHYNHLANERTAAKRAEYKVWIQSHTPEQIRLANNARAQLRAKLEGKNKSKSPAHTARLVDERQPKRPVSGFAQFVTERYATGDYKGILIPEASKIISGEWKSLSASEKKKYEDTFTATQSEYLREKAEKGIVTQASTKA